MTNSNNSTANGLFKRMTAAVLSAVMMASALCFTAGAEEYTEVYEEQTAEVSITAEDAAEENLVSYGAALQPKALVTPENKVVLAKTTLKSETKFSNGNTHPFNYQTSRLKIRWEPVEGAERYQIYVKGGDFKTYTKVKTVLGDKTAYTVKDLKRNTGYKFKVRAIADGVKGEFSDAQFLRTARIDFDAAGWQAMCRIVYHEVGGINDSMWDAPIVHVADCVVNQYEAAKYLNDPLWAPYYRNYNNIQSIIYTSGGFMSDYGLASDGATYAKCTSKVKMAVYGAVYNKVTVSGIKHDKNVFYWCNTGYKPSSSKVAYVYRIPWGYFNIWREYWG
ncbi:MAG: fibronectin type III domain-containing protein [Oscillospiraceae bacterium]